MSRTKRGHKGIDTIPMDLETITHRGYTGVAFNPRADFHARVTALPNNTPTPWHWEVSVTVADGPEQPILAGDAASLPWAIRACRALVIQYQSDTVKRKEG